MSIATKRVITALLNTKRGVMRPSYMAVMYCYDLMGKGRIHNSYDINSLIDSKIELTRVTISRLHKQGYLEYIETNLHRTTDKWRDLLKDIDTQAKSIRIS